MSIVDLKSHIINRLNAIEDEVVLGEIYNLIRLDSDERLTYKLSAEEYNAIAAGLKDVKNGKVFSSDEANALIREWRKK